MEIKNSLVENQYTKVVCERKEYQKFNAPHHFEVITKTTAVGEIASTIARVNFQEGPIKENAVNGVTNEDLLLMVLTRLQGFQESEFASRENAIVIEHIETALLWSKKRTLDRELRNVEGTSQV